MAEKTYQIVVNGTLVEGADPATTKQNVAALFKVPVDKVEPMFSGKPMVIKKGLDAESAKKYMLALKKAGLVSKGVAMGQAAPETPTSQPSAPPPSQESPQAPPQAIDASLATVGAQLDDTPLPGEPDIDISAYAMGETGEILVEASHIPVPDIDTSQLDVNEVGQTLDESPPPAAPEIDTSTMSVAAVGEDVMEHTEIPEADIDISQLTMAEAGEDVMKHEKVPDANIDTSKLSLDSGS